MQWTNRFTACGILAVLIAVAGCQGKQSRIDALRDATPAIALEKDRLAVESTLVAFDRSPQARRFIEESFGFAVFPTVGKAGLAVGGAHGKGWVFRGNTITGETYINQLSFGFQLGVQTFSQIVFFEDESAYSNFTSGNFEFGAQASAVVITVGANAQASTVGGVSAGAETALAKTSYTKGMAVVIMAKAGLMYEATVSGEKFSWRPFPVR